MGRFWGRDRQLARVVNALMCKHSELSTPFRLVTRRKEKIYLIIVNPLNNVEAKTVDHRAGNNLDELAEGGESTADKRAFCVVTFFLSYCPAEEIDGAWLVYSVARQYGQTPNRIQRRLTSSAPPATGTQAHGARHSVRRLAYRSVSAMFHSYSLGHGGFLG